MPWIAERIRSVERPMTILLFYFYVSEVSIARVYDLINEMLSIYFIKMIWIFGYKPSNYARVDAH
jgi:hypothetical protein